MNNDYDSGLHLQFCFPKKIEKDFNTLIGMLKGIKSDSIIKTEEVTGIAEWILSLQDYNDKEPYKELLNRISIALEDYHFDEEEIEDLIWYCEKCVSEINNYHSETSAIQQLYGILDGISIDNEINKAELVYLKSWLFDNQQLEGRYPFDMICKMISSFLIEDNILQQEYDALKKFCQSFKVEKINDINDNKEMVDYLKAELFDTEYFETFINKNICITGESTLHKRSEIATKIIEMGAKVVSTVTSKTDMLIICDKKSHAWSYSMYGRKLEQAINLRSKGHYISIIHIDDFLKLLDV